MMWLAALQKKDFQPTKYSKTCVDQQEEACFESTGQTTRQRETALMASLHI